PIIAASPGGALANISTASRTSATGSPPRCAPPSSQALRRRCERWRDMPSIMTAAPSCACASRTVSATATSDQTPRSRSGCFSSRAASSVGALVAFLSARAVAFLRRCFPSRAAFSSGDQRVKTMCKIGEFPTHGAMPE
ncbi:hypothetical protein SPRG_22068, partial [Saprolegnia parasitica CBS 223.65]